MRYVCTVEAHVIPLQPPLYCAAFHLNARRQWRQSAARNLIIEARKNKTNKQKGKQSASCHRAQFVLIFQTLLCRACRACNMLCTTQLSYECVALLSAAAVGGSQAYMCVCVAVNASQPSGIIQSTKTAEVIGKQQINSSQGKHKRVEVENQQQRDYTQALANISSCKTKKKKQSKLRKHIWTTTHTYVH